MKYIETNLSLINGTNQLSEMFDEVYGLRDIYIVQYVRWPWIAQNMKILVESYQLLS